MRKCSTLFLAVALSLLAPQYQFGQSNKQASSLQSEAASQAAEKIYLTGEVDREAELKNLDAVLSKFSSRLHCNSDEWTLTISAVLRKTGNVTDEKVENMTGCQVSLKAVTAIIKQIKFTPATKDGLPVSQLYELDVKQELQQMINTKDRGVIH